MQTQESYSVKIKHNFDPKKFKFLWAKYVHSGNLNHHCAQCMRGKYSKLFSGYNENLLGQTMLDMNEVTVEDYKALYFCGVIKEGYPRTNYPHNVHFIVIPSEGSTDHWEFENWNVDIENGILSSIPEESDLDDRFFTEPYDEHFYTCRNFRWMVGFFYPELLKSNQHD